MLSMSKMSKIDQLHLRAVMLCVQKMSKMGKEHTDTCFIIPFLICYHLNVMLSMSKMLKIDQIELRAVMLCMSKMSKMGKEHTHTFWLITSVFNAFNAMYLNTSNIKQCALTHIDMHPLMYTQQIRWQWVTMGVNEWLPHYLIRSGSHCYSNFNLKWLVVRRNNPK